MGNDLTTLLRSVPGLDAAFAPGANYTRMAQGNVKIGTANHKVILSCEQAGNFVSTYRYCPKHMHLKVMAKCGFTGSVVGGTTK